MVRPDNEGSDKPSWLRPSEAYVVRVHPFFRHCMPVLSVPDLYGVFFWYKKCIHSWQSNTARI